MRDIGKAQSAGAIGRGTRCGDARPARRMFARRKPTLPFRRGLAPLELVMSLPLLLLIMALMIVFGTASSWKIRTEVISRDAVWRNRSPRLDNFRPWPEAWPRGAAMSAQAGAPFAPLDDPALRLPVVSGPRLGSIPVHGDLLNFSRGAREGFAHIERRPPMVQRMNSYQFDVTNTLLDDKFQYRQMGMSSNRQRRIPVIYSLPVVSQQLLNAYRSAVSAIDRSPVLAALRPLDRDDEFIAFYGSAPDFHPQLRHFCSLDSEWVEENRVEPLIERIEDLPERMARAFIRLYRTQLAADPPPPPAVQAALQHKISLLQQFLASL